MFLLEKRQKGFTLVEILVVIAIVGLLGSIIFAVTRGADEQGRIAKGLYFSQHLQNSLGSYAVGIWRFDEGSGTTANDTSGWNNYGMIYDATYTTDTPSGKGYALSFNGSSDYVDVGNDASLKDIKNAITFESWIKLSPSFNSSGFPFYSSNSAWFMLHGSKTPAFSLNINGTQRTTGYTYLLSVDKWYHIVNTWDGSGDGKMRVYVNADLKNESDSYVGTMTMGSGDKLIGRSSSGSFFNGIIDEVRIYSTSLTSVQIQSHYYAGLENLLAKGQKGQISQEEYQQRLNNV